MNELMEPPVEDIVKREMRWRPGSSWQPVLQRSIDGFYQGKLAEGAAACRILLNAVGLPGHIRDLTYQNQTYYAQPLSGLIPGAEWTSLAPPLPAGWAARDPSPAVAGDRLTVLMRATPDGGSPALDDLPWPLRERVEEMELVILRDTAADGSRLTQLRPFFADNVLHVAAVTCGRAAGAPPLAGVLRLSEGDPPLWRFCGPRAGHYRQGWSPVVTPDGPRFVSWWEPTELCRIDPVTHACAQAMLRMAPHIAERFQGASPGVSVPGGSLFLVNEVVAMPDGREIGLSRFTLLNERFQITHISPQFFLTERGAELATGLARRGGDLVAGFTARESEPILATMALDRVLAALLPVEAPGPKMDARNGKESRGSG